MKNERLESLVKDVEQRFGRNVLLCQQMEVCVKHLAVRANVLAGVDVSDSPQDVKERLEQEFTTTLEQRTDSLKKKTLGGAITAAGEQLLSPLAQEVPESEAKTYDVSVRAEFRAGGEIKEEWNAFLNERNELVHCFLEEFDLASEESAERAILFLDEQFERLSPIVEAAQGYVETEKYMRALQEAVLKNPAIQQTLCVLDFVQILKGVAEEKRRSDGWTDLQMAMDVIRREHPNPFRVLKTRLGKLNVKTFLREVEDLEMSDFEVREEKTSKGGVRILYRLLQVNASGASAKSS